MSVSSAHHPARRGGGTVLKFSTRTQSRMSALSLYVTTCRMVLLSNADDGGAWADVHRLLSYLRQALSCSVCGNLLMIPMSPAPSTCQHNVCKSCVGGTKRLKPSCSWCKDYSKYLENTHLRILLQCYKKLCNYLSGTGVLKKWGSLNCGMAVSFSDVVEEGCALADDHVYSGMAMAQHHRRTPGTCQPSGVVVSSPDVKFANNHNSKTKDVPVTISRIRHRSSIGGAKGNGELAAQPVGNGLSGLYSIAIAGSRTSAKIAVRRSSDSLVVENRQVYQDVDGGGLPLKQKRCDVDVVSVQQVPRVKPKRRGCRCGLATPNPGKLTCCGQRCPCYGDGKACIECKCRGCRNPHKPSLTDERRVVPPAIHLSLIHGNSLESDLQLGAVEDHSLGQILVAEVRTDDDNSDIDVEG